MWIVVGLGNPGEKYAKTRHNIGFMAIDAIASFNLNFRFHTEFSGLCAKGDFAHQRVVLAKPQTFMNLSGTCVQALLQFYKSSPEHTIVIHDDLDLEFGAIRVKQGGGHGGHNGLKDISRVVGPDFFRIRLGIGKPVIKGTEPDYVLANYRREEMSVLETQIHLACDAVKSLMNDGLEKTQAEFNRKQNSLAR